MGSDGESRDGIRDQPGSQLTQPVTCDLIMQHPPSLIHFYEICFFIQVVLSNLFYRQEEFSKEEFAELSLPEF